MNFSIKIKANTAGVEKFIKKEITDSERKIEKQVKEVCFKVERETKMNLRKHVSSGRLIKSYSVKSLVLKGFDTWGQVGSDANYAPYVEFGTRPHFPPVAALERWAKQKGLNPWVVAKSIAQKGTEAHPHFWPAAENVLSKTVWEL